MRPFLAGIAITAALASLAMALSYSTSFPSTENPISSGGWVNGLATGLVFANVRTTPGLAFGTQVGNETCPSNCNDSTAVLTGSWGPTQTAQATIHVGTPASFFEEVELRLRTTITANSITGYEINCSVSGNAGNFYLQIVRWNGALGSYNYVTATTTHCVDGDVLKATISGSTITAYVNNVQQVQGTDATFTTGNPGVGFFMNGGTSTDNANFGFTAFSATDGLSNSVGPPIRSGGVCAGGIGLCE